MAELSTGVKTLIARMESNPEEFYGEAHKWRFIFKENFREVMTEPEKGALHEALKVVRRKELDVLVVKVLLEDEMKEQLVKGYQQPALGQIKPQSLLANNTYGEAQIKQEGAPVLSLGSFK